MHPIDRAAGWLFRFGPDSLRVFRDGWGDEDLLDELDAADHEPHSPTIAVEWGATRTENGLIEQDGSFQSPASSLPAESARAAIRRISPSRMTDRLVVMMAAWNDHRYATRTKLARLLAERGIATVLLENPLYGSRRAHPGQPIRTVADFAVMGRAAVAEGRALLAHFATTHAVGVTGYSMGGNTAALVGAIADQPTAIAALAASHSPAPVWLDGVIRQVIDWEALGGESMADRLRSELSRASVLAVPPRPHTAAAVIVAGTRDGYIPTSAVRDLHAHFHGARLRWVDAGHATLLWRHRSLLADAVVASFDRLAGL